jgi:hypothetical protein
MMQKHICNLTHAQEQRPSLTERIARLRRRQTAATQLIASLTAYAELADRESELTYPRNPHDLSLKLPASSLWPTSANTPALRQYTGHSPVIVRE